LVDFDEFGLRRSIQLKVLGLNDNGLVEIGTWTNTNRLGITSFGAQQMTAIRKHLQVVTREVRSLDSFFSFLILFIKGKTLCCTKNTSKWFDLFRRILFVKMIFVILR
jgi:hypothetical protein